MLEDTRELLEMQGQFLLNRDPIGFVLAVGPFLDSLGSDPRLAALMNDLLIEADQLGRAHAQAEAVHRVSDLAVMETIWLERTQKLEPDQWLRDNVNAFDRPDDPPAPAVLDLDPHSMESNSGLWAFVELVEESRRRLKVPDPAEGLRPGFDRLYEDADTRQRALIAAGRHHAGVALMRLMLVAEMARGNSPVVASRPGSYPASPPALQVRRLDHVYWESALAELVIDPSGPPPTRLPELVGRLKEAVELVLMELRRRLGLTRSVLALIDRFRVRAQSHDRKRLAGLADDATRPEERLRDELARYLFDQGLNPMTEVSMGVTRSDLLDPSLAHGFLLEAKQYKDGTKLETAIKAAYRQAQDTAGELGEPYAADEGFVVLFRRGGPRATLPADAVESSDGRRWYFRLVDLLEADKSGSRAKIDPENYDRARLQKLLGLADEEARAAESAEAEGGAGGHLDAAR